MVRKWRPWGHAGGQRVGGGASDHDHRLGLERLGPPREETPSPQAVARRASRARPTPPAALGKEAAARSTLTCRALCRASLKASLTPPPPPPPAEPDDGGGTVE